MDAFDRIDLLITRNGMSGSEMSRELGLSNSVYSQWKSRTTKPSNKNIKKIADYFGVSVEYIKFGETNEKEPPSVNEGKISINERAKQILSGFSDADDGTLMLDGKPASREAVEAFELAVEQAVEMARKVNEQRKKE